VVLLLAVACGASVANIYYAQPLLHLIAHDLGVAAGTAGLLVTFSQLGYAVGLLLLVPLGDLLDRRRMVARMLVVVAAAMVLAAAAPSFAVLALAIAVAALASVVAQVLVAFAGTLAAEDERGRVVGIVMSGLLLGILLARTVSGLLAAVAGWRLVFGVAAVLMLVLAAVLARLLPSGHASVEMSYGALLRSVAGLVRDEPALRRRMAYGALAMGSFSVLWTAVAFLLSGSPYHWSEAAIGMLGLAGLVGAGAAQSAGRLFDRGYVHAATGAFVAAVAVSWLLLALGGTSAVGLIAGVVLLDLGVQGQQILSQGTIYELRPDARSRITTAYMTSNFVCGALASAAASAAWSAAEWAGVCVLGGALSLIAVAVWIDEQVRLRGRVPAGVRVRR
jgi:predicted MFS family arabinose efflux permease